jgi:4-methyl-5(b-hydroxyethyl)-thiazole monophosphate biosynthesis
MQKHAIILLADGFEEIETITPIDLLRRAGIAVTTLGIADTTVCGSHGITICADMLLEEFTGSADALILPGGPGHKKLLASTTVIDIVKKYHAENRLCAAICAAPVVFAVAGILNDVEVTCFPGNESKLDGAKLIDRPIVIDNTVITARAAGNALDFSLAIIHYLAGKEAMQSVASAIVYCQ